MQEDRIDITPEFVSKVRKTHKRKGIKRLYDLFKLGSISLKDYQALIKESGMDFHDDEPMKFDEVVDLFKGKEI